MPIGVDEAVAVWDSGRTETMINRSKYECHILDFCQPDSDNENTAAILEWARQAQAVKGVKMVIGGNGRYVTTADFITEEEIEIIRPGQVIEWASSGGYAYGDNFGALWDTTANRGVRLRATGGSTGWFNTTGKRIRTRRLFRGSSSDPQDAPLSCVLNIQAEGVHLIRPHIWLDCDYSTDLVGGLPNLGDYCDVGIFVGTRVGVQIHDAQILGYFRRAGIYIDVSGDGALGRMLDKTGNEYPAGTVKNGADGTHLWNPYIRGARQGLAVLGAQPKPGSTGYSDQYYDQADGLNDDKRGSFGCSDFLVTGGRIYGPDHHSNRRLKDPVGLPSSTNLSNEPDDAPCGVKISGLAGNGSGALWGMRFVGTRIATFEAIRFWTDYASRVTQYSCHIEGRSSDSRLNTSGVHIDTNDTVNHSYGDWAATPATVWATVRDSVRSSKTSFAPHFYGETLDWEGANGRNDHVMHGGDAASAQDYRSGTEHRHRLGNVSKHVIDGTGVRAVDGFYSGSISIANNDVGTINPAFDGGQLFLTSMGNGGAFPNLAHCGHIGFDVGVTPNIAKFAGGASLATLAVGTVPNGTTGVSGNTSVSAVTGGTFYVENRSGGPVVYYYTIVR